MKRLLAPLAVIALLILACAALIAASGCSAKHPYTGPTIGTVGITGSYADRQGDTYGGGVQVGLNYPTPTPKPVDHSK